MDLVILDGILSVSECSPSLLPRIVLGFNMITGSKIRT